MNVVLLLSLLLLLPFLLFLGMRPPHRPNRSVTHISGPAYLALSSCMGDGFRASIPGVSINPRHASFGRAYGRTMGSGAGQAGWEQIEMQGMLDDSFALEEEEEDL